MMLLQECNHMSLDEKIRNHLRWDEKFKKNMYGKTREKNDWWMMGELFKVENETDEN